MAIIFFLEPGICVSSLLILFFFFYFLLPQSFHTSVHLPHLRPTSPSAARPYTDGASFHLISPKINSATTQKSFNNPSVHQILKHTPPSPSKLPSPIPLLKSINPQTHSYSTLQIHSKTFTSPSPTIFFNIFPLLHPQIHKASISNLVKEENNHSRAGRPPPVLLHATDPRRRIGFLAGPHSGHLQRATEPSPLLSAPFSTPTGKALPGPSTSSGHVRFLLDPVHPLFADPVAARPATKPAHLSAAPPSDLLRRPPPVPASDPRQIHQRHTSTATSAPPSPTPAPSDLLPFFPLHGWFSSTSSATDGRHPPRLNLLSSSRPCVSPPPATTNRQHILLPFHSSKIATTGQRAQAPSSLFTQ